MEKHQIYTGFKAHDSVCIGCPTSHLRLGWGHETLGLRHWYCPCTLVYFLFHAQAISTAASPIVMSLTLVQNVLNVDRNTQEIN